MTFPVTCLISLSGDEYVTRRACQSFKAEVPEQVVGRRHPRLRSGAGGALPRCGQVLGYLLLEQEADGLGGLIVDRSDGLHRPVQRLPSLHFDE